MDGTRRREALARVAVEEVPAVVLRRERVVLVVAEAIFRKRVNECVSACGVSNREK